MPVQPSNDKTNASINPMAREQAPLVARLQALSDRVQKMGLRAHAYGCGKRWNGVCSCQLDELVAASALDAPASPQTWQPIDVDDVIQQIAELPDRCSPDDWPEAMLVTAAELRQILTTYAPEHGGLTIRQKLHTLVAEARRRIDDELYSQAHKRLDAIDRLLAELPSAPGDGGSHTERTTKEDLTRTGEL